MVVVKERSQRMKAAPNGLEEEMSRNHVWVVIATLLVAAAGFAVAQKQSQLDAHPRLNSPRQPQESVRPRIQPKAGTDYRVIGYIEKQGQTITIKAWPSGPVYSVKTAAGKVLCENLTREQLMAQAPELGNFLKAAMAGTAANKADASLRVRAEAMGLR
jgi:hypothetical protein